MALPCTSLKIRDAALVVAYIWVTLSIISRQVTKVMESAETRYPPSHNLADLSFYCVKYDFSHESDVDKRIQKIAKH